MPYSNVPRHLWGKMDSCVKDVMARERVGKQQAIRMCHASIVKEADVTTARQKRKLRRAAERRAIPESVKGTNSDPAVLAALALGDDTEALTNYLGAKEVVAEGPVGEPEPGTADLAGDDDVEPDAPPVEGDEEPEPDKAKAMASMPMAEQPWFPFDGATTWPEYDAYIKARDQARNVDDLTYVFNGMVENVMRSEDIPIADKADAISALATGYKSRIGSASKGLGGIVDVLKRTLGGASRNDLPDSAFAYIEPGGKKDDSGKTVPRSLRHYPINDEAHIRNALSRAAAAIEAGGKTAEIARHALAKIRAAAKRHGIGKPAAKPGEKKSGFEIIKGADGKYRWIGWSTNKWRDRDLAADPKHGGEILTSEAHKAFVEYVYQDPLNRMPALWLWHTPGTLKAKADWLDYADGFLISSGPLTDDEAESLMAVELVYDLGMSHGLHANARDKEKGYITSYTSFEQTVLPVDWAANPWTAFGTILKEATEMGFNPDKRKFLVAALGEERVAELEGSTEAMAKAMAQLGIEHKEAKAPVPDAAAPAAPPAPVPDASPASPPPAEAGKSAEGLVVAITEAVVKAFNPQGLSDMLKTFDQRLSVIEKGQAKALAEAIRPKAGHFWDRPSQSAETLRKEGDPPVAEPALGQDWVEGAFGNVVTEAAAAASQPLVS